jgi:TPP-dependent pyruvate/acetoin dehydrogenase alpha subunit
MIIDPDLVIRLYASLYRIRRVEEEIARIYPLDKIKSPIHLSIGQEAVSVGVCEALSDQDVVFGTYRGHALYLAKGGDLKQMIAELFGKATGCAEGKGGSMHLVDVAHGVMGTSAVVGTTIPNAVGYALALKYRGDKSGCVVSFLGDGAIEEGVFWESLNFATLKSLPVIFVCENNKYAIHSSQESRQAVPDIAGVVGAHGLPSIRIESGDVFQILEHVSQIVPQVRAGGHGPVFIECVTYRWKEHVGPLEDYNLGYRERDEAMPWIENDQVQALANRIDPAIRGNVEKAIKVEIEEAFSFAEESKFPDLKELYTQVFKES